MWNFWVILMLKTYLMFIGVVVVHSVCPQLTDRPFKDYSKRDFVYIFPTNGVFTSKSDAWYQTLHAEIKLRLQISTF